MTAPETTINPKVVLVASGKGGVGTSLVASLVALAANERHQRVLLIDATEAGGSLHLLFGMRPTKSLWSLSDATAMPDDALMHIDEQLTIVAGGTSADAALPKDDSERRAALMRIAHVYPRYDLIVIDGGVRLDTLTAISELTDPEILLVTSADRLALAANYALVKTVGARTTTATISIVANRHGETVAKEACDFLIGACSHFLGRSITVAGVLPDDPCLQAAIGAGMCVTDALDGSPAADTMRGILLHLLPLSPPPRTSPRPAAVPASLPSSRRWS